MLQEKTPLQRKTRSKSAGEGRKAGRGGRGRPGRGGRQRRRVSWSCLRGARESARLFRRGGRGREEDRALFAIVCRNQTPWNWPWNWQHDLGILERRDFGIQYLVTDTKASHEYA